VVKNITEYGAFVDPAVSTVCCTPTWPEGPRPITQAKIAGQEIVQNLEIHNEKTSLV
jgi:hypothetical protein